jgi:DNA-binding CsgD family transcriptional regulator/tetratricopeptide (TPR) repeat protein
MDLDSRGSQDGRVRIEVRCPALVEREGVLDGLVTRLEAAGDQGGQFVVVLGEAGVGKTRLVTEAAKVAAGCGAALLWGGCPEQNLPVPYLPFVEALSSAFPTTKLRVLAGALGSLRVDLGRLLPQVADDTVAPEIDPAQAKPRLFEAVACLLEGLAERSAVMLVLEDLHWADSATCALLDYLWRRLRAIPVLLVGTIRSDELTRTHPLRPLLQSWRRSGTVAFVDLEPLSPGGVDEVLSVILAQEAPAELVAMLHERTGGNPFLIEELLREAIERGDIYRTSSGWGQRRELADFRVPESLAASITERVDALGESAATVLRAASALAGPADAEVVSVLAAAPAAAVEAALRRARDHHLLEIDRQDRYRFRHHLVKEAVYNELPLPDRLRLHRSAAEWIAARPERSPGELAHHLLAAGQGRAAVPVALEAADAAIERGAFREAAGLLERVAVHAAEGAERAQVLCRLGEALHFDGSVGRAEPILREGIEGIGGSVPAAEAARYRLSLGMNYAMQSKHEQSRLCFEGVLLALAAQPPSAEEAMAHARLAMLAAHDYDSVAAAAEGSRAIEIAKVAGASRALVLARNFLGYAHITEGRVTEGLNELDSAADDAVQADLEHDAFVILSSAALVRCTYLGARRVREDSVPRLEALAKTAAMRTRVLAIKRNIAWFLGELPVAEGYALAERRVAHSLGLEIQRADAQWDLASLLVEMGRLEEARPLLSEPDYEENAHLLLDREATLCRYHLAVGDLASAGRVAELATYRLESFPYAKPSAAEVLVEALVADGQLERAAGFLEGTEGLMAADPAVRVSAARVVIARDATRSAVEALRSAAAEYQAAGYRVDEARARAVLASALCATGDRNAAADELTAAANLAHACCAVTVSNQVADLASRLGLISGSVAGSPGGALARVRRVVVSDESTGPHLSDREKEVLILLAEGRTDREIADALIISITTVRSHLDRIRDRTGCRRRADLTRLAIEHGLATAPMSQ